MNETQAAVAKVGAQNQLSAKLYGLVGLAAYQALQAGGAPPPALAGALIASQTCSSCGIPHFHTCWFLRRACRPALTASQPVLYFAVMQLLCFVPV